MARKILLADDSVTIRKVVELTFSDEDFSIVSVGDGAQALERVRAERPDIVISDVIMPGLNGYELCQRIKSDPALRGIPVLFLRGTFEGFDEERARASGADGFIVKPFEARQLVEKVKELIASASESAAAAVAAPAVTVFPQHEAQQHEAAFDFDFGEDFTLPAMTAAGESRPPSPDLPLGQAAEGEEDLWSEVSLQGTGAGLLPVPASSSRAWEEPSGLVDDDAIFDEISVGGGEPTAQPEATGSAPVPEAPPMARMDEPPPAGIDREEIERILTSRLDAAVRQVIEPLMGELVRKTVEEIAWEVIPDLAEAMIRAEIERVRRASGSE